VAFGIGKPAAALYHFLGRSQDINSLAVLPFVNASGDSGAEYLSDGITDSLINRLSRLPKLKVMSHSAVFRYKGRETDPLAVGRELKVNAVLTGRLEQRGESLSIGAELVDMRDNSQIWGEQYRRRLADMQAIQEDIGLEITDRLRLKLTGEQKKWLSERNTQNTQAYREYLKGCYHSNKRTGEGLKTAIEHFEQAIAKDPGYALAYFGLAECYGAISTYAAVLPRDSLAKARTAALKALQIDGSLAEAHTILAAAKTCIDWDWAGGERDFKRGLELNPRYPNGHAWYASPLLVGMGRLNEALVEQKRAQELDPTSLIINTRLGDIYYLLRQYDQALEQHRQTLALDMNFGNTHLSLGSVYIQKSMYPEAIAELQTALKLLEGNPDAIARLAHAYAVSGNRVEAQKILADLTERSKRGYFPAFGIATVYLGLGDKDRAFQWLQKAIEERGGVRMMWLKVDPLFDPLRSDQRFSDLLHSMNLAP